MKEFQTAVIAAGGILAASSAIAAGKVYVTAAGAKIVTEQRATARTVATVPVGTALSVTSQDGKWYQVIGPDGARGWIYRGKVSETPPPTAQESQGSGAGDLFSSLGGSGISAGAADTSRSVRGLSAEAAAYAKETDTAEKYRTALDHALNLKVKTADVDWFLKEGKIGEYAE